MNLKQLAVVVCASVMVTACQDRADDAVSIAVEANDMGIQRVEIQHGFVGGDRTMTIRGLDWNDQEIALVTLRTGAVLYTPEPDLIAEGWSAGTELTASMGAATFSSITPDVEAHETPAPDGEELAAFVRLPPVAVAIQREAGIRFAAPRVAGEIAFSASNCSGSRFPTNVGDPLQCCEDGNATWHKINGGTNDRKLGARTYAAACTTSSGGTVCGNPGTPEGACTYGPCGARNVAVASPNDGAAVYHPASPNGGICGRDSNDNWPGGSVEVPHDHWWVSDAPDNELYYAGVVATCPYVNCCYNPYSGVSEAHADSCPAINGESCSYASDCYSDFCNPYTNRCDDYCGRSGESCDVGCCSENPCGQDGTCGDAQ